MKLEHFGMAEPGDCRLVFTAGAEELAAAIAQVQAGPDVPQEEDGLLTEAGTAPFWAAFRRCMSSWYRSTMWCR